MVEIYSMSFTHSSLIINIILILCLYIKLNFAFVIIFMERRSLWFNMGLATCFSIFTNYRVYFIFTIRTPNSTQSYF